MLQARETIRGTQPTCPSQQWQCRQSRWQNCVSAPLLRHCTVGDLHPLRAMGTYCIESFCGKYCYEEVAQMRQINFQILVLKLMSLLQSARLCWWGDTGSRK